MLLRLATRLVIALVVLGALVESKIRLQSTWSQNSADARVYVTGVAVSSEHNMVYTVGYTYGEFLGRPLEGDTYDGHLRGFYLHDNASLPIADRLESRFDHFITAPPGVPGAYYRKVTVDEHGTAYAAGFTRGDTEEPITGGQDLLITAMYRDGSLKWQKQFTTAEMDAHAETRACPIVYKAGFLHLWMQHSSNTPLVVKLRAQDGEIVWTRRPVTPTSGSVRAHEYNFDTLGVDGNLNIYFTAIFDGSIRAAHGDDGHSNRGSWDWLVVKLDPDGEVVWRSFVGTSSADYAKTLACNDQGVVVVAGEAFAGFGGAPLEGRASDAFLARIDSDTGALMWTRIWNDHETSYYYDEQVRVVAVSPTAIFAVYRIRNNLKVSYLREFDLSGAVKQDFGLPGAGTTITPYGAAVDSTNRLWLVAAYSGTLNTHPTAATDDSFLMMGADDDEFTLEPNCSDWRETLSSIESALGISQS